MSVYGINMIKNSYNIFWKVQYLTSGKRIYKIEKVIKYNFICSNLYETYGIC